MNIIYGLRDPMTDDYKYVGKSTVGIKRAQSHLFYSHNPLVREWVLSLIAEEQKPIIDILETCDDPIMLIDKEKYWINRLLADEHPLLNILTYSTVAEKNSELEKLKRELDKSINSIKTKIKNTEVSTIRNIGNLILRRRKLAGLSRNKLSEIAGIGKTVIYDIEHGKITVQLDTLQKILSVLNIKLVFYFGENDDLL